MGGILMKQGDVFGKSFVDYDRYDRGGRAIERQDT